MPDLTLRCIDVVLDRGGRRVLSLPSLTFHEGPPSFILGPNGAGKSLLLRLLHGLERPDRGQIEAGAVPLGRAARRRQAMVFQRPIMLRRSVAANIAFALKQRGGGDVTPFLAAAGLQERAADTATKLSGGEAQRLALARALALKPDVLFLDEPTASLDPAATWQVEAMIARAVKAGVKIIMVTHDPAQARRLAGDVVFLHHGHVLEHRPASAFFEAAQSAEARRFLAGELVL